MHPNPEEITVVFVAAVARILCSMASTEPGLGGHELSLALVVGRHGFYAVAAGACSAVVDIDGSMRL
ncbi:hypothetical protein B296_00034954 [Ensete ventricosum]|uniref:Uncharacterized protein n=1 Tax=Ensete ventricosum TaxID=4639 RepID=A0A426ZE57_ENSVE|nr:hypothetical protein B296_00034954 [Ensete ventricosum]